MTQVVSVEHQLSRPAFHAAEQTLIGHEGNEPLLAASYFSKHGTADDLVARVFDAESRWIVPADTNLHPDSLPTRELADHYLTATRDIYVLAQESIGHINWFGYNDHGPLHIQRVVDRAMQFSLETKLTPSQTRNVIASAAFHDLGNLVNRDIHSLESPIMAAAMFPRLLEDSRKWEKIERAIQVHELGTHKVFLRDSANAEARDRVEALRDIFHDEGLVLILADKVQFTRERVNSKALKPEALLAHRYSQLNFYWETTSAGYDREEKKFVLELTFRPDVREDERARFGNLALPSSRHASLLRAVVPEQFSSDFTNHGKSYFSSAEDLFWQLSTKLMRRVIECGFALYDGPRGREMDTFEIRLRDPGAHQISSTVKNYNFTIEDLDTHPRLAVS